MPPRPSQGGFILADSKARYWWGVLYPENMVEGWETKLGDIVELPFCYCLHSVDTDTQSEHRKDHIHLILAWNNNTTYRAAFRVFQRLNAPDRIACNKIQEIVNIRNAYEYLIHNTDSCKAAGKHLYLPEERIQGNNFDIGFYEQLSVEEKREILRELLQLIIDQQLSDFVALHKVLLDCGERGTQYFDVMCSYSSIVRYYLDSVYHRSMRQRSDLPLDLKRYNESLESVENDKGQN